MRPRRRTKAIAEVAHSHDFRIRVPVNRRKQRRHFHLRCIATCAEHSLLSCGQKTKIYEDADPRVTNNRCVISCLYLAQIAIEL